MNRRIILLLSLSFFIFQKSPGQTQSMADYSKLIEVLPPSPNAASLGRYGGLDLTLSTGMPNINIGLYEYRIGKIRLPISIAYSSAGVRVDEIASRVGTGWSLNCGGVVTRTVVGMPDEASQAVPLPSDFPSNPSTLLPYMKAIAISNDPQINGPDAQPDVFNFNINGFSGRFVLDASLQAVQLLQSGIKIETNFPSTEWNFKITTPDGIQYFLGGQYAKDLTKKYSAGAGCGKPFGNFVPTAWYLNKVIHPNNETAVFTYEQQGFYYSNGLSESIYSFDQSGYQSVCLGFQVNPSMFPNTVCEGLLFSNNSVLKEITCAGGEKIKFTYVSRSDNAEVLLQNISIYPSGVTTAVKLFDFVYQQSYATTYLNTFSTGTGALRYRPFLMSVTERSTDNIHTKKHEFNYNDINALPPRLSFAQDHYGFFNGRSNTTLIPTPDLLTWQQRLPSATADRGVNSLVNQKGMLTRVIYPTGGYDDILYESNQEYRTVTTMPGISTLPATAFHTGIAGTATVTSSTVTIAMSQEARIVGSCQRNDVSIPVDPVRDFTIVNLYKDGNLIWTTTKYSGETFDVIQNLTAGSNYYVKTTTSGNTIGSGSLLYMAGSPTSINQNVNVGGLRVQKVSTVSDPSATAIIKRYYYNKFEQPDVSSGNIIYYPRYDKYLKVTSPCMSNLPVDPQEVATFINCSGVNYHFYTIFSSSQNNIYAYGGAPITYQNVTESFGENYEGGKIEHTYQVFPDLYGNNLKGDYLLNAPLTSFGYKNGLETLKCTFQKGSGTTFLPVKKIITHYKEDPARSYEVKGFVCNKKYESPCQGNPTPSQFEMDAFDLYAYSHNIRWQYVDEVKTQTYAENGIDFVEEKETVEYGNMAHALPTKIITSKSTGDVVYTNKYYPQDLSFTGGEETARLSLVSKNMISPVLVQEIKKGTMLLSKLQKKFIVFPNGLPLPSVQSAQTLANGIEERLQVNKYDAKANIVEQQKTNDSKQSYIYDYKSNFPIAQVSNSGSDQIAATSFEADGAGNWVFTGTITTPSTGTVPTGKKYYSVTSTTPLSTTVTVGKVYIVSYWRNVSTSSPFIITGGTSTMVMGPTLNSWSYFEHKVTATSTTLTISGTGGGIDELRLYPTDALMVTYTYDPLFGVTSQCDANNRITYYEYDGLGRLYLVRDRGRNITKRICYNYKGQTENCLAFVNDDKSANYTRNNCGAGYTGGSYYVNIPSGTYISAVSVADANLQATTYGQAQANTYGVCIPSSGVTITSNNYTGVAGFNAVYTNVSTGIQTTFAIPSSSATQTLGTIPAGTYNIIISKSGNTASLVYGACGYGVVMGTSASFSNIAVSSTNCNNISLDTVF